jgi:murein peptide amidase A
MSYRVAGVGLIVVIAAVLSAISSLSESPSGSGMRSGSGVSSGSVPDRLIRRRFDLGDSVRGREIIAFQLGDPDAPRKLLIVGCIHGNESAGIAIARRLEGSPPLAERQLWAIADLNPDGVAFGIRQNAHGVDLNRNFPWRWRPLAQPGAQQYSGPHPLSEPEARIARSLILRVRPGITIWFHQPLGVVDESGGTVEVERRFAHLIGLPLRRLSRYPGSATGWTNHRLAHGTSFVVELPPGPLGQLAVRRDARDVLRLAD